MVRENLVNELERMVVALRNEQCEEFNAESKIAELKETIELVKELPINQIYNFILN